MNIKLSLIALSFTTLSLQSCTGVSSVAVGDKDDNNLGPVYFLPTTKLPLFVSVDTNGDGISISASEPVYIADEQHRYRLKSIYSPFHAETFDAKVSRTGLLNTLNYESDGRLDEAAQNALKSVGALVAQSQPADGKLVLSREVDLEALTKPSVSEDLVSEIDILNSEINQAILGAFGSIDREELAEKPFLLEAESLLGQQGSVVALSVVRSFGADKALDPIDDSSKCSVGFCYRLPVSYTVTARFFDDTIQQTNVYLPNGSPTYAAAVKRGVFTKWSSDVSLHNGMLVDYKYVTDGSEAERLAALPFELVGSFIQGITKQGELFDARSTLIDKKINLDAKKKEAREAKLKQENYKPGSMLFNLSVGNAGLQFGSETVQPEAEAPENGGAPSGASTTGSSGTGR
ncbi:hypothetical protein [Pelagibius sp. Alg239-R121]|uniref:hypothetical protein n=1 Tax=Pelagibius sp. Alg239-R121 TaxID=2993448 RepID=UPI0024A620CC|nr:hypothetical protein [Pelagibius sp. Alg239-R121]